MKSIEIKASLRSDLGKKGSKNLRKEGKVPCEYYGPENIHFAAEELALKKIVYTPNTYLVNLDIDGNKKPAIMRDIQFHPLTDRIIHIDFEGVAEGKPVKAELPVVTNGASPGVLNGGKLKINFRKVTTVGNLELIPDNIEIDISKLKIGHSVRVSDLKYEGLSFLHPENDVVVAVRTARGAVELDEDGEEVDDSATEGAAASETPAEG